MNNQDVTPDQQIDAAVEMLKAQFVPQARNQQQAELIKLELDAIGHKMKAVSAIVNDKDFYKAVAHAFLSRLQ